jgi:hypothetical protein
MNANAPHHATNEIDHTIDRALSALRDAQPRSGSEQFAGRILANLEHRAAAPRSLRPHFSVHLALWTATSAAILAIASLIILHKRAVPNEFAQAPNIRLAYPFADAKGWGRDADARRVPQVPAGHGFESPRTSIEPTHRMAHRSTMPVSCPQSGCPTHDDGAVVMDGVTSSQTPTDAQLLADLHAPSHPAPPVPLTPQEKLFLRMLRYGDATELAELDPMVRANHDADETRAFKAFFPDPPPLQQPGDSE